MESNFTFFISTVKQAAGRLEEVNQPKQSTANKNVIKMDVQDEKLTRDTTSANALFNELAEANASLTKECDRLNAENHKLKEENEKLWRQTADLFQRNRPSQMENICNPHRVITLGQSFHRLYNNEWHDVWEEGDDDCSTLELLSGLMEKVNTRCVDKAKRQLKSFLNLQKTEALPSKKENPELYKLRYKENIDPTKRLRISSKIVSSIFDEEFKLYSKGTEERTDVFFENLRPFFAEFTDICWLTAIAEEEIMVDFDAIGRKYEGEVRSRFDRYSMRNPVFGSTQGDIKTLVWPCLRKEDGTVIQKGAVVVVDCLQTEI